MPLRIRAAPWARRAPAGSITKPAGENNRGVAWPDTAGPAPSCRAQPLQPRHHVLGEAPHLALEGLELGEQRVDPGLVEGGQPRRHLGVAADRAGGGAAIGADALELRL